MFERLLLYFTDTDDYVDVFILSGFFTLLSVFLVYRVVPFRVGEQELAGVMAVLLTSLAMAYPFVRYLLIREQEEAKQRWTETQLLRRHAEDFTLYLSFFLAATLAFAVSTFFVPEQFYTIQMGVLESIGAPTGQFYSQAFLMQIINNNLWVFMVTFILTFFVTSGVVFVLAWNASVLGVLIGMLSRTLLEVPLITLPYLPHGLLEIGGYVLAGISGALLSYAVEQYMLEEVDWQTNVVILKDSLTLFVLGVGLILVAGVIEVI